MTPTAPPLSAVAADVYAADERVRRFVSTSDRSRAEVALWGDTGALGQNVSPLSYRLSAACPGVQGAGAAGRGYSQRYGGGDGSPFPLRGNRSRADGR